jgi:hypothetical protein
MLIWWRAVGNELHRDAVLMAAEVSGGVFVVGILLFLAKKFL